MSNFFTGCNRRQFLGASIAGAAALAFGPRSLLAAEADPYGGFNMGIQSYSLRGFDLKGALERTQNLGLKFWEAYPGHLPLTTVPAGVAEQKALLAEHGITLMAYGVVGFNEDENNARKTFDYAKAIGLKSISANPKKTKGTFDLLDKLVAEYDIPIAIHNHGPKADYDKIDDCVEWTKDRHPLIGACVDTGHYLRSDESPVEAIERLGKRVFGVHLKDVRTITGEKKGKVMTILGEGDLDIAGCLKALKKHEFKNCLSIEYEENPKDPISDLKVCLESIRKAVASIAG
ncbi:MAG: sugar phosphate isomerase/epimerase [Planctomycetaceae bacterium]